MKLSLNTKQILIISVIANILLIGLRNLIFDSTGNLFLIWNLFLATIPLIISSGIKAFFDIRRLRTIAAFCLWMLFLPNAPYIITDLVHLQAGSEQFWIDMLIILLTAMNGLIMGFISIKQMVKIVAEYFPGYITSAFEIIVIIASAYGVYMGRFMRYNSWDIFIKPLAMAKDIYHSIGAQTMLFVITFSLVSYLLYKIFRVTLLPYSQEVS
jgi:uncharacterized membrane protein